MAAWKSCAARVLDKAEQRNSVMHSLDELVQMAEAEARWTCKYAFQPPDDLGRAQDATHEILDGST
jgi:hypothetical protein